MRILDRMIDRIVARAKRTPYFHLPGYMERYWLFRTRWLSCRLHVILRSDREPDLHDHPYDYATVILRGGYVEVRPTLPLTRLGLHQTLSTERECIAPGRVLLRRAESLHRLEVPSGQTCLTLFFLSRKRRSWGFQTPNGWVYWRDYPAAAEHAPENDAHWRGEARR